MADQLKGSLATKDTAPKDAKASEKDAKVRDDEEAHDLTDEERQANREAYLRAWPLDADIEKR